MSSCQSKLRVGLKMLQAVPSQGIHDHENELAKWSSRLSAIMDLVNLTLPRQEWLVWEETSGKNATADQKCYITGQEREIPP